MDSENGRGTSFRKLKGREGLSAQAQESPPWGAVGGHWYQGPLPQEMAGKEPLDSLVQHFFSDHSETD